MSDHDPGRDPEREFEQRLRDALRREADGIDPPDRFGDITARLPRSWRYLWPVIAVIAAAVVLIVGTLVVVPLVKGEANQAEPGPNPAGPGSTYTPSPSPQTTQQAQPTTSASPASPTASGGGTTATRKPTVPVYYLGESTRHTENGGDQARNVVFREYQPAEVAAPGRPTDHVAAAVQAMADHDPRDPDYRTAWVSLGQVHVTDQNNELSVDLSGYPLALPQGVSATDAMQQLVWTATAAYVAAGSANLPVVVTVEGKTKAAWGSQFLGKRLTRDGAYHAPVWITDPQTDQHDKAGAVTISGVSTAFEGTVQWRIADADTGKTVAEGHTMGGANGKFGTFSFTTQLKKGHYTVMVFVPDMTGNSEMTDVDSKTWFVD